MPANAFNCHHSVRKKETADQYVAKMCARSTCTKAECHYHCPLCRDDTFDLNAQTNIAHFSVCHVFKALSFSGLKILRCCRTCCARGVIRSEKRFEKPHWHCFYCKNAFRRREEAIRHYKAHFRNIKTYLDINIANTVHDIVDYTSAPGGGHAEHIENGMDAGDNDNDNEVGLNEGGNVGDDDDDGGGEEDEEEDYEIGLSDEEEPVVAQVSAAVVNVVNEVEGEVQASTSSDQGEKAGPTWKRKLKLEVCDSDDDERRHNSAGPSTQDDNTNQQEPHVTGHDDETGVVLSTQGSADNPVIHVSNAGTRVEIQGDNHQLADSASDANAVTIRVDDSNPLAVLPTGRRRGSKRSQKNNASRSVRQKVKMEPFEVAMNMLEQGVLPMRVIAASQEASERSAAARSGEVEAPSVASVLEELSHESITSPVIKTSSNGASIIYMPSMSEANERGQCIDVAEPQVIPAEAVSKIQTLKVISSKHKQENKQLKVGLEKLRCEVRVQMRLKETYRQNTQRLRAKVAEQQAEIETLTAENKELYKEISDLGGPSRGKAKNVRMKQKNVLSSMIEQLKQLTKDVEGD